MSIYLGKAIKQLRPTAEFSYIEDDYDSVKWDFLEGTAPTKKEIDDTIKEIKANEITDAESRAAAKAALLARLGITEDEARLLLA